MPGLLSGLFDSDGSNEQQPAETVNIAQDGDPATDDTTSDGAGQPELVAVDVPQVEPGQTGDAPNEAMM